MNNQKITEISGFLVDVKPLSKYFYNLKLMFLDNYNYDFNPNAKYDFSIPFKTTFIAHLQEKAELLGIAKIPITPCKKYFYVNMGKFIQCFSVAGKPIAIVDLIQKKIKLSITISSYEYRDQKQDNIEHVGITIKAKKIHEEKD